MTRKKRLPILITNQHDDRIFPYRDVRDADLRGRNGLFLIESEKVLRRALQSKIKLHSVLITPTKYERIRDEIDFRSEIPIFLASLDLIKKIAGFDVHRGVLAAGFRSSTFELEVSKHISICNKSSRILLLEGVTNVDNLGGLFRTAAGLGWDAIYLDKTSGDPLYRKSIRVSMGHVFSIPWKIIDNWNGFIKKLKKNKYTTFAAEINEKSQMPVSENQKKIALVVGSEGYGLRSETIRNCDHVLEIPMSKKVDSLNVVVAAGIIMHSLGAK